MAYQTPGFQRGWGPDDWNPSVPAPGGANSLTPSGWQTGSPTGGGLPAPGGTGRGRNFGGNPLPGGATGTSTASGNTLSLPQGSMGPIAGWQQAMQNQGPPPPPQPNPDIASQQGQYSQDLGETMAAINTQLAQQAGLPQPNIGATGANQTINQLNQQAAADFTQMFDGQQRADWQYAVDAGAISEALMRQLKTMPPEQASQIAMNKIKEMNLRPGGNAYQWFG